MKIKNRLSLKIRLKGDVACEMWGIRSSKNKLSVSLRACDKLIKRMKKITKRLVKLMGLVMLSICLSVLSGCGIAESSNEPEEVQVVSAIGVDPTVMGVKVSLQLALADGKQTATVSDEGESVLSVLPHLAGDSEKERELSHCALIAIGDGVGESAMTELLELCRLRSDIPDAVLFVCTQNAGELLSAEGAVGYGLAGMMRRSPRRVGLFSGNRFYEIEEENGGVMALPYFYLSEHGFELYGLKLYLSGSEKVLLDRNESSIYLMLRGIYTSGLLDIRRDGIIDTVRVSSARTVYENVDGKKAVRCILTLEEDFFRENPDILESQLEEKAIELYESVTSLHGDLFCTGGDIESINFEVRER